MLSMMTRNLAYRTTADRWLRELLGSAQGPDVALLQEVLPGLLESPPEGYELVSRAVGSHHPSGRSSAVLVRQTSATVDRTVVDEPFVALGTYAAPVRLTVDDQSLWIISVHASPKLVAAEWKPAAYDKRSCEPGAWWSDVFLAELRSFGSRYSEPAVIAGDLNEAIDYDTVNGHQCGKEFFDSVAKANFKDMTTTAWGPVERATRRDPDYQLDRVFASDVVANHVAVDLSELVHDEESDHAAIWFRLAS